MQLLFISGAEIFVVLLIILLLFGADKIPSFVKTFGNAMKEMRKVTNDIKEDIEKTDMGKDIKDINKTVNDFKTDVNKVTGKLDDAGIVKDAKNIQKTFRKKL